MSELPEFFERFAIKLVALPTQEVLIFLDDLCKAYQTHNATLINSKRSRNNSYQSFNLKLCNVNKETLDEIYSKLSAHKDIKWVI